MSNWKLSNLIIALVLLFLFPIALSEWNTAKRQDRRNDELVEKYECEFKKGCFADFNGDGRKEQIVVDRFLNNKVSSSFVVFDGARELLRRNCNHTDNTLRTHIAINNENGLLRLLVYDKASREHTIGAFVFNGDKLEQTVPDKLDREILEAMASRDDTGGWDERVIRGLKIKFGLLCYYTSYAIIVAWIFYKRRQQAKLTLP